MHVKRAQTFVFKEIIVCDSAHCSCRNWQKAQQIPRQWRKFLRWRCAKETKGAERVARGGQRVVQNERDSNGCGRKKQPKRKHTDASERERENKEATQNAVRLRRCCLSELNRNLRRFGLLPRPRPPRASMLTGDARLQTNKQINISPQKQQFPTGERALSPKHPGLQFSTAQNICRDD